MALQDKIMIACLLAGHDYQHGRCGCTCYQRCCARCGRCAPGCGFSCEPATPQTDRAFAFVLLVVIVCLGALLWLIASPARGAERAPMPQPAGPIGFAEVISAALTDARSLPAGVAAQTRYLDARNLPPADRRELYAVICYHANGLSREAKRVPPRKVTEWLWAIDLTEYRWSAAVWEDLKRANHYYALRVQTAAVAAPVTKTRPKLLGHRADGSPVYSGTEEYTEPAAATAGKEDFVAAPWLPPRDTAALTLLTGSATPIVRADEFLFATGAQADGRDGHGYYDFLGLGKKIGDAEKLATLDRKKAIDAYRELAAVVNVSGVALANRQLFRFQTVAGAWWESRDAKESTGAKNAVSNLLDDFKPDAYEVVFTLPNGLPGFFLADAKGDRQDTAPDFIAADHRSGNNDRRVHAGFSCVACHTDGGLKPIRDYMRRVYTPETGLALASVALDPATARRLESAYLGPLQKSYDRDRGDFGEAIEDASGLKPAALAAAYARQWSRYADDPVTLDRAAAECGVSSAELRDALRRHARAKGVVDPVLAAFLAADPPPLRREHFEERFGALMLILGGVHP